MTDDRLQYTMERAQDSMDEILAHFAEVHGTSVSKDTISRITDKVIE